MNQLNNHHKRHLFVSDFVPDTNNIICRDQIRSCYKCIIICDGSTLSVTSNLSGLMNRYKIFILLNHQTISFRSKNIKRNLKPPIHFHQFSLPLTTFSHSPLLTPTATIITTTFHPVHLNLCSTLTLMTPSINPSMTPPPSKP